MSGASNRVCVACGGTLVLLAKPGEAQRRYGRCESTSCAGLREFFECGFCLEVAFATSPGQRQCLNRSCPAFERKRSECEACDRVAVMELPGGRRRCLNPSCSTAREQVTHCLFCGHWRFFTAPDSQFCIKGKMTCSEVLRRKDRCFSCQQFSYDVERLCCENPDCSQRGRVLETCVACGGASFDREASSCLKPDCPGQELTMDGVRGGWEAAPTIPPTYAQGGGAAEAAREVAPERPSPSAEGEARRQEDRPSAPPEPELPSGEETDPWGSLLRTENWSLDAVRSQAVQEDASRASSEAPAAPRPAQQDAGSGAGPAPGPDRTVGPDEHDGPRPVADGGHPRAPAPSTADAEAPPTDGEPRTPAPPEPEDEEPGWTMLFGDASGEGTGQAAPRGTEGADAPARGEARQEASPSKADDGAAAAPSMRGDPESTSLADFDPFDTRVAKGLGADSPAAPPPQQEEGARDDGSDAWNSPTEVWSPVLPIPTPASGATGTAPRRPTLTDMYAFLRDALRETSLTLVLGLPGVGKTSYLTALGEALRDPNRYHVPVPGLGARMIPTHALADAYAKKSGQPEDAAAFKERVRDLVYDFARASHRDYMSLGLWPRPTLRRDTSLLVSQVTRHARPRANLVTVDAPGEVYRRVFREALHLDRLEEGGPDDDAAAVGRLLHAAAGLVLLVPADVRDDQEYASLLHSLAEALEARAMETLAAVLARLRAIDGGSAYATERVGVRRACEGFLSELSRGAGAVADGTIDRLRRVVEDLRAIDPALYRRLVDAARWQGEPRRALLELGRATARLCLARDDVLHALAVHRVGAADADASERSPLGERELVERILEDRRAEGIPWHLEGRAAEPSAFPSLQQLTIVFTKTDMFPVSGDPETFVRQRLPNCRATIDRIRAHLRLLGGDLRLFFASATGYSVPRGARAYPGVEPQTPVNVVEPVLGASGLAEDGE